MAPKLIFIVTSMLSTSDSEINKPKVSVIALYDLCNPSWNNLIRLFYFYNSSLFFQKGFGEKAHNVVYFIIANIAVVFIKTESGLYGFENF
jgi:hypothetical protein